MTFSHPNWVNYKGIETPQPLTWKITDGGGGWVEECFINDHLVAWLEPRPHYCDRGHFHVNSDLPGIDGYDGFPRYYMSYEVAKAETEAWLKWRLWKVRYGA